MLKDDRGDSPGGKEVMETTQRKMSSHSDSLSTAPNRTTMCNEK